MGRVGWGGTRGGYKSHYGTKYERIKIFPKFDSHKLSIYPWDTRKNRVLRRLSEGKPQKK